MRQACGRALRWCVPLCRFQRGSLFAALAVLCVPALAATRSAVPAVPEQRISLEKLGYRPALPSIVVREGYTMSTVDMIDDEHVLVTFNARKLIPRMQDPEEANHQDRLIKAVVLHLPDGRLVHETEWRTHDHNQYLWPMGRGYFLLRQGNLLTRITPLKGFEREPLLESRRPIEVIQLSPARDMMLIETSPEHHIGDDPTVPLEDTKIEATFYTIREGSRPTLHIRAVATEERRFATAFTSRGLLGSVREDREHWGFDFHPFGGKAVELAGFTSTCQPLATFVSDAEFIATGCRGGTDRRLLGGFDLAAQANWVFTVDDTPVWPAMSAAPGSGRFAVRTTMTNDGAQETGRVAPEEVTGQQVRVYSFRDGKELLRATLGPVQQPSQNFSLSPDGRRLAVLHEGDLELYKLPAQTADEVKDEKREEAEIRKIASEPERAIETLPETRVEP